MRSHVRVAAPYQMKELLVQIGRRWRLLFIALALSIIFVLICSYGRLAMRGAAPALLSNPTPGKNASPTGTATVNDTASSSDFIGRSDSSLILAGRPFRFSGANIYWLGLRETSNGGATYPSHFMVDDALVTASLMGATVVRSHTLGISVGCQLCIEPSLDQFNPIAFQHIDYAIRSAQQHHLRLIIPLVDNWHYYPGGKHTFTDWHGISNESAFYYNGSVVQDFKHYVSTILNHVNSYTGVAYKDDPTILAWETGNELSAPFYWVQAMATYIKSVDSHHLLMDGNYGQTRGATTFWQDLKISAIDLYTGHYYPPSVADLSVQARLTHDANKVFIVGEYDWNTSEGDMLNTFLTAVLHSSVAGDLYWSLFPHNDAWGYVSQNEHYTLHYPGNTADMQQRIQELMAHAYAMQGRSVPTKNPPGTPSITSVEDGAIAWRGAAGASTYSIERSTESEDGGWTVICNRCATDFSTPWVDKTRPERVVWYRVRGYSVSGVPGPYSNVVAG